MGMGENGSECICLRGGGGWRKRLQYVKWAWIVQSRYASEFSWVSHMVLYIPLSMPINPSWVPDSMMLPFFRTKMVSNGKKEYKRGIMLVLKMPLPASRIVFNRCATWKLVMPVSRMMDLKLARSDCSVCVSNADVASSRKSILGFLRMVRARATRCFSPPIAHTMIRSSCHHHPQSHILLTWKHQTTLTHLCLILVG